MVFVGDHQHFELVELPDVDEVLLFQIHLGSISIKDGNFP